MTPWLDDGDVELHHGDVVDVLRQLPAGIAQTCITSPPYWGLRDYSADGQIGLEASPDLYVERLVAVFREVWRVLRADGTVWLNLGDSYNANQGAGFDTNQNGDVNGRKAAAASPRMKWGKPKDLVGIPWRVAFALQTDGWYLRSDIIWNKPNPMPESVVDRPTKAHEMLFLLSKRPRYFYDADAIREPGTSGYPASEGGTFHDHSDDLGRGQRFETRSRNHCVTPAAGRNRRSVWTIPTEPFPQAHFATYPQALVRPCILAGTSEHGECSRCGAPWVREVERTPMVIARSERTHSKGHTRSSGTVLEPNRSATTGWRASCTCDAPTQPQTVLDPFIGSGTTALVARNHARRCIGIDLSAEYLAIAARRLQQLSLLGDMA